MKIPIHLYLRKNCQVKCRVVCEKPRIQNTNEKTVYDPYVIIY